MTGQYWASYLIVGYCFATWMFIALELDKLTDETVSSIFMALSLMLLTLLMWPIVAGVVISRRNTD